MNTQICKASLLLTTYLILGPLSGQVLPSGTQAMGGNDRSLSIDATSTGSTIEWHYALTARIRLLLPWLNFRNVGGGRIVWTEGLNGVNVLELLVGSDPTRAPRRINRWGYLSERINGSSYDIKSRSVSQGFKSRSSTGTTWVGSSGINTRAASKSRPTSSSGAPLTSNNLPRS